MPRISAAPALAGAAALTLALYFVPRLELVARPLALLLWVRNLFGLAFLASLCDLLVLLLWKGGRLAQLVTAFLAMQLTLSVFSRSDYLFTSRAQTAEGLAPSDTAQIADAL